MKKNLLQEFMVEVREFLDQMEADLLALEQSSGGLQIPKRVLRNLHTVKGNAGMLGCSGLADAAHAAENSLAALDATPDADAATTAGILLRIVDGLRGMVQEIESAGSDAAPSQALRTELEALASAAVGVQNSEPTQAEEDESRLTSRLGEILVERGLVREEDIEEALHLQDARTAHLQASRVRVDVQLLDRLMNLVGELVLVRNQFLEINTRIEDRFMRNATHRLDLIASQLQEEVVKTRMQPISTLWSTFPRYARDLAQTCGREVALQLEGEGTELDRTLMEAIKDPLVHLVRNAIDHGLEPPDERERLGKSRTGRVTLRALHEAGQVVIEVDDDGRGIDPKVLREQALHRGVLSREQADGMSDTEFTQLLFMPGFTTRERVTDVSGRGVGLDVVHANVERIGGVINLESHPGQGTTLQLKIPLTLAITPALIVSEGNSLYALPQANVVELIRLHQNECSERVERTPGLPVYRLRGRLLPLIDLGRLLHDGSLNDLSTERVLSIVVLQAGARQFGLVVDRVVDSREIVVKSLDRRLKHLPFFTGATLLGDGRIALILNVVGLASRASLPTEARPVAGEVPQRADPHEDEESYVLVRSPDDGRMLVPLASVVRLDELPPGSVEHLGPRETVQYHGEVMTLIRLARYLEERRQRKRSDGKAKTISKLPVLICANEDRKVILQVDGILDIVRLQQEQRPRPNDALRAGVAGIAVVRERITELLDIDALLRAAP